MLVSDNSNFMDLCLVQIMDVGIVETYGIDNSRIYGCRSNGKIGMDEC